MSNTYTFTVEDILKASKEKEKETAASTSASTSAAASTQTQTSTQSAADSSKQGLLDALGEIDKNTATRPRKSRRRSGWKKSSMTRPTTKR